jgi:secreted trypsin-like serine protease
MNKIAQVNTKIGLIGILCLLVFCVWIMPAAAITWGELDEGDEYPNVGMMRVLSGNQLFFICTGTLIHPRVVLTAGHCIDYAEQIGEVTVEVTFHPDGTSEDAFLPVAEYFTHPEYNSRPRSNPHDVGVLILADSVDIEPAELPDEGFLDQLKREGMLGRGSEKTKFTVVGYGATLYWPPPLMINSDFKRRYAESEYRALLPAWLRLSQNDATDDEGTCLGDSGGPAFYSDSEGNQILVGTISWGDPNCIATGFNYRTDIIETMEFIEDVIDYVKNVEQ